MNIHSVVKMEFRGLLAVFAAVAVVAFAEEQVTYPEIARQSSSRIVSGWGAKPGQLPFQLSIRMVSGFGGVSSCGASIIHSEWALTAAHCSAGTTTFVVRAGTVNLTRPEAIFETTGFFNHPLYNNNRPSVVQPHDIGLMPLGRKLKFTDNIQPIRLQNSASKNRVYTDEQLVASGWGRTWTNGASPENLQWVYLSGESNSRCRLLYGSIITDETICANGYNDTTQSTCQGDSGGPLTIVDEDDKISQVGVTSFVSGAGCHADMPAGFIRPGHYHAWFTEVTGVNFDWELEDEWDPDCSEEEEEDKEEEEEEKPEPEEEEKPEPEEEEKPEPEEEEKPEPEEEEKPEPEEEEKPKPEEEEEEEEEEEPEVITVHKVVYV